MGVGGCLKPLKPRWVGLEQASWVVNWLTDKGGMCQGCVLYCCTILPLCNLGKLTTCYYTEILILS